MTDLFVWLPVSVLGVAIVTFLAILRRPDEATVGMASRPGYGVGAVRLATIIRSEEGLVIDGLVDRPSPLGSVGAPVTLVVSELGLGASAYRLLTEWVDGDAVVDLEVPLGPSPQPVIDLRCGDAELRVAIVARCNR